MFTAWGLAGLAAPYLAGVLYDYRGDYTAALFVASVLSVLAAAVAALLRPVSDEVAREAVDKAKDYLLAPAVGQSVKGAGSDGEGGGAEDDAGPGAGGAGEFGRGASSSDPAGQTPPPPTPAPAQG